MGDRQGKARRRSCHVMSCHVMLSGAFRTLCKLSLCLTN
jgi:hypothetical protein